MPKPHQLILLKVGNKCKKNIIAEIGVDWENLALLLEFDNSVIRIIRENHSGRNERIERSCQDMLHRWLDGEACQPVTWKRLIEALRGISNNKLAREIEQLLLPKL